MIGAKFEKIWNFSKSSTQVLGGGTPYQGGVKSVNFLKGGVKSVDYF